MKYEDSDDKVQVGDEVTYAGAPGIVVFVIDDDAYSNDYPKQHWAYLGKGVGIELRDDSRTLYHLDSPDEDLVPVHRLSEKQRID